MVRLPGSILPKDDRRAEGRRSHTNRSRNLVWYLRQDKGQAGKDNKTEAEYPAVADGRLLQEMSTGG